MTIFLLFRNTIQPIRTLFSRRGTIPYAPENIVAAGMSTMTGAGTATMHGKTRFFFTMEIRIWSSPFKATDKPCVYLILSSFLTCLALGSALPQARTKSIIISSLDTREENCPFPATMCAIRTITVGGIILIGTKEGGAPIPWVGHMDWISP